MKSWERTLADGRRVSVHGTADGGGQVVVVCHAAPGSGGFDPDPAVTGSRRIRLLAVDRPGYGASDPPRSGTWAGVDAAADDLAQVLDGEGVASAGVVGWSAGGRVALALAARRPDLVERVAVVATPAPQEAVPWIPEPQLAMLDDLRALAPDEVHARLTEQLAAAVPADAGDDALLGMLGAGEADSAALAVPGARERLATMLRAAVRQGAVGMAVDIAGYCLRPWGFERAAVRAKVLLLYGSADPVAAGRHGRWWQSQLPQARLEMVPGAGHLLIIPTWDRVLSHLAPGSRSTRA
jgi:pimeloyl-ACP methyl ester carboxylesterase